MLDPGGVLVTVLQLPGEVAEVTPSPYAVLGALSPVMRLVPPAELARLAAQAGFRPAEERTVQAGGGKRFQVQEFRLGPA